MTKKNAFGAMVVATAVALSLLLMAASRAKAYASTDDIKVPYAVNIGFGDEQVTPDAMHVRAFVPTGSMSTNCLATLSESNEAAPGITVFCAPREYQGQKGILFSAFFPQPITSGLILSATIHQDYANGYGAPVFYPGI
jgi:hypothetical protein